MAKSFHDQRLFTQSIRFASGNLQWMFVVQKQNIIIAVCTTTKKQEIRKMFREKKEFVKECRKTHSYRMTAKLAPIGMIKPALQTRCVC